MGAIVVALVCFALAFGVNVFYNEAHEARGLNRASFQALFLALLALTLLAVLTATWLWATAQDEVVRTADRISVSWGYTIGAFIWCMTPWLSSLPEALARPCPIPTVTRSSRSRKRLAPIWAGGLILILIVSACASIIKACWWLAKR